jgi:tight adherence protein C
MFGLTLIQIGFLLAIFVTVTTLVLGAYFMLRRNALSERLSSVLGSPNLQGQTDKSSNWVETFVKLTKPLAKLSLPSEGWANSSLKRKFIQAGVRTPNAPSVFFAIKTALAFGLPLFVWLAKNALGWNIPGEEFAVILIVIMLVGFYGPNAYIDRLREARQLELFQSFPDALDLMTISMEAGLGLDQAIIRVAKEIRLQSPVLADELELFTLEVRAGANRQTALRNLALRTGVEDIDSLIAMLIQSERFGTSVADALRVHSFTLRIKRQQRAEEMAAKVAIKLVFPLVLCIFPSILIVVVGPAMIQIGKTFGQIFGT